MRRGVRGAPAIAAHGAAAWALLCAAASGVALRPRRAALRPGESRPGLPELPCVAQPRASRGEAERLLGLTGLWEGASWSHGPLATHPRSPPASCPVVLALRAGRTWGGSLGSAWGVACSSACAPAPAPPDPALPRRVRHRHPGVWRQLLRPPGRLLRRHRLRPERDLALQLRVSCEICPGPCGPSRAAQHRCVPVPSTVTRGFSTDARMLSTAQGCVPWRWGWAPIPSLTKPTSSWHRVSPRRGRGLGAAWDPSGSLGRGLCPPALPGEGDGAGSRSGCPCPCPAGSDGRIPANLRYTLLRPGEPRELGEPGRQRLVGAAPAGPPSPGAAPLPGTGRGASSAPQEPWGHVGSCGMLHPRGWASCVGSSCAVGLEQLHGARCQHPQGQSHRSPPAATPVPCAPAGLGSAQPGLCCRGADAAPSPPLCLGPPSPRAALPRRPRPCPRSSS